MTQKHSPLTELMHAVLDGEASDAEARELDIRLAADPAARAEFEDWKRLFEALEAVPREHVPEGLAASIASALPRAPGSAGASGQPFPGRRVLGDTSSGISPRIPPRSVTMTEQSSRRIFAHRKAWLGGGLAAAAAVVVAQIAFDFPLTNDVVGTVIPAQRYRAAQNGSEQVQLGTPAGQVAPTGTVPEASRALAEKSAAESALQAERMQKQAELVQAERMQKQAELVQAERMQKQAELVQAERMQKQAELVQAERMQKQAELVQAERMQKQAELVQAERMQKQAERVQADRMQKQVERVQADRTSQQQ